MKYIGRLENAVQVAHLLRNNCFNAIDYFYLGVDESTKKPFYETYPLYFPAKTVKLRIDFRRETTIDSPYLTLKHNRGLYSIRCPEGTVDEIFDARLDYDKLGDLIDEYNRINMAVRFLPDSLAAGLRPDLDSLENIIADSLQLEADFGLDQGVFISDLKMAADTGDATRLLLLMGTDERLLEDYSVYIHAYPDDVESLNADRRQYGFANFDYYPDRGTSDWIVGEYVLVDKAIDLNPGKYRFRVGLFNKASGRLSKIYISQYLTVY